MVAEREAAVCIVRAVRKGSKERSRARLRNLKACHLGYFLQLGLPRGLPVAGTKHWNTGAYGVQLTFRMQ